jgi:hypothetical protein
MVHSPSLCAIGAAEPASIRSAATRADRTGVPRSRGEEMARQDGSFRAGGWCESSAGLLLNL